MSRTAQPAAAAGLSATVECGGESPPQAVAHLRWEPAAEARAQRVEVTIRRDGFATGRYEAVDVPGPDTDQLDWTQLQGQAIHFWRVVTLVGQTWTPSHTAEFEGPGCAVDYISQPGG